MYSNKFVHYTDGGGQRKQITAGRDILLSTKEELWPWQWQHTQLGVYECKWFIPAEYTLSWSAVVFICKLILLFEVVFCLVRTMDTFDFTLVIKWMPNKWQQVGRDGCVKDTCVCYKTYMFTFEVWTPCMLSRSKLFSSVEDSMSEDYGVHTESMLLLWS